MSVDTRTALLNAAERAARALGPDGFSYAHLAREVGIRKASIHHHFPTKSGLLLALTQRYRAATAQALARIDEAHGSAAARIRALIAHYEAALEDGTCLCLCVALSVSHDRLTPEITAEIAAFRDDVTAWIDATFRLGDTDGTLADGSAATMLATLEGAQLAARAEANVAHFARAVAPLRAQAAI